MSKEPSLGKLAILYTIGNLASKIISFGLFFLYTFYLSKQDIGSFDLIISTITLFVPILSLQINDSVLRWLIDNNADSHYNQKDVITNGALLLSVTSLLVGIICIAIAQFVPIANFELTIILLLLSSVYPLVQYVARGLGQNRAFVVSGIIYSIVFCLLSYICLSLLDLKLEGVLISNIAGTFVAIAYLALRLRIFSLINFRRYNSKLVLEMIRYSIPLIPNTLSWWGISMANRYIIIYFLGLSANGTFAVAMKFPTILLILTNIFYMAWQEKAIHVYNSPNRNEYYTEIFNKYASAIFSVIVLLIVLSKPLINIFVEKSYKDIYQFLPFLYLAIGYQALSSFYGTGYLSAKETKKAFTSTIFGAIATLLTSLMLIPVLSLHGASIAILIGYVVLFFVRMKQTRRYFTIQIDQPKFVMYNVLIILSSALTWSDSILIAIANIFVSILIVAILNFHVLMELLSTIKQKFKIADTRTSNS